MADWQAIWQADSAKHLWSVPDPRVVEIAQVWKAQGRVRRVLDLGCGVGRHVIHLAREGFEVHAVDPSSVAIDLCRERLAAERLDAQLSCGSLTDLRVRPAFFDAVIAFNSIYHAAGDDVETAVRVVHRALRPAGHAIVTLPSLRNRLYGRGQQVAAGTYVGDGLYSRLFPGSTERGVPHFFASEETVRRLFRTFKLESLRHEELCLPRARRDDGGRSWFRVPGAWFWRVVAVSA